jgi:hypothetical protein
VLKRACPTDNAGGLQLLDLRWVVAHLVDLIYHAGHECTVTPVDSAAVNVRTAYLLEYGTAIMQSPSMWQVGRWCMGCAWGLLADNARQLSLEYFSVCGAVGKAFISRTLQVSASSLSVAQLLTMSSRACAQLQQLRTYTEAQKVMDACVKYGLEDELRDVQAQLAASALRRGAFGTAVHWLLERGDLVQVSQICHDIVELHVRGDPRQALCRLAHHGVSC